MATGHWLTNRGKKWITDGGWADDGPNELKIGLLQTSQPVTLDSAAEVADLNVVNDLLVLATEATFTNYTRQALVRAAQVEDDATDKVLMDIGDVTWASAGGTVDNTIVGAFFYTEDSGTEATRELISVHWFSSSRNTNGSSLVYAVSNLYEAA